MTKPVHRSMSVAALVCSVLAAPVLAGDGDLDPTFWSDGKMGLEANNVTRLGGMATRSTGHLAVGYSVGNDFGPAYWRTVGDSSLGTPCNIHVEGPAGSERTTVWDVAFDASDRLIVLAQKLYFFGSDHFFAVLAYDYPYCRLDKDFGTDGMVVLPQIISIATYAERLATTSDGKILIVGNEALEDGQESHQFSRLIRLEADGDFDPTFDGDGVALGGEPSVGKDLTVAPNGHIVVAAWRSSIDGDFLILDFDSDGTFLAETSVAFDLGGTHNDQAYGVAATTDGRIVVVGKAAGNGSPTSEFAATALLSWNAQGELELDPSFSGDGKLAFRYNSRNFNSLSDVLVDDEGRILVAGTSNSQTTDYDMSVARIELDGTLDSSFYPPGYGKRLVAFDLAPPDNDLAKRLVLQNGLVVLGGSVNVRGANSVGFARLEN